MNDHEAAAAQVSLGAWIQQRRKALDLTQDDLARRVGCSLSAIRKIERDERRPSVQVAELLAEHLRISSDQRETFLRVARAHLRVDRLPPPALTSAGDGAAAPSNLPLPRTPLVGREPELAALGRLLGEPPCRLLTLTGPGGIGKTRLAIEAASRCSGAFPDGVHFVPLASLGSPTFLVPAIADSLGFAFQGQADPRAQLLGYLQDRQALLVLDNAEHLLDGAELLAEVLEGAPKVKLLVTSRERLSLRGEWLFELQGLPVPPPQAANGAEGSDPGEGVENYSAIALFAQSARRVQAGFALAPEERPAVARICRLVEGMPLAIELAAAWVSVLSCREIEREIERSLDFLTTSMRDVPKRHLSLRAAFDHSWALLSADERVALSRLSVFRGGFEREAAAQIAGATLPLLSALLAKSLVRRAEGGRYDLHEVVRQYALTHLADDPRDEATTRDRHCDYYLSLLRDREKDLKGAAQQETIRELTDEIDNLRGAWDWAVKREKFVPLGQALRTFGVLCDIRGWLREGIEQGEPLVRALRHGPDSQERRMVLGQALAYQSLLHFRQGQHDRVKTLLEESLGLLRPIGDPGLLLDALIFYGIVMFLGGDLDRAQSLLDEGLACARAAGDSWFAALALINQGIVANMRGRYTEAYEQMRASLDTWRELGDQRFTAFALNFLSPVAIRLGRPQDAQAYLQESLALSARLGDRWGTGTAYCNMGLVALAQNDIAESLSRLRQAVDLFTQLDMRWDVVRSLTYLGEATAAAQDWSEARRIFLDALRLGMELQATPLALDALIGLAHVQSEADQAEQAMELSVRVEGHAAGTQDCKDRAGRLRAALQQRLPAEEIQAAQARARANALEVRVEEILAGTETGAG